MPPISPATSLPNQIYNWRGYHIRYQVSGPIDATRTLLLVHGLFVNSDHWRKTLTDTDLQSIGNCRVYAIDLLGCGWSSKPKREDEQAMLVNGENGRFLGEEEENSTSCYRMLHPQSNNGSSNGMTTKRRTAPVLVNVPLGTAAGGHRVASTLELRHPLNSVYNFYTWAEQLVDFTRDVIHVDDATAGRRIGDDDGTRRRRVTLVANSIGTMSSFQSIMDEPGLFNGCFVVNPNFRELHSAEVPFSYLTMPLVRYLQSLLRNNGHALFQRLATPETVTTILKEPYSNHDVIDEELITVLLDPLLTTGADDVVFDTLSYSAGPLPEQQLCSPDFPSNCPVWVVYGKDDPWTPSKRVENLGTVCVRPSNGGGGGVYGDSSPVERIVGLDRSGHCPHDECPQEVNDLILEFLDRLDN